MADIEGEVARTQTALNTPTLKLLTHKWAAIAVPILAVSFPDGGTPIPVERFHAMVDARLDELRVAGYDVPAGDGKALAMFWVREKWLFRDPGDGEETYQAAGDANQAVTYVARASRTQLNVSLSRIVTLMDVVSQAALAANPNREERVLRLSEEIARLTAERDRLAEGGEMPEATEAELSEQFSNVLRELDGLPSDFRRVEEAVRAMHRVITRNFREESRPIGEVVDDYLDRSRNLLASTPEGRAFAGALDLLRNPDWVSRLRQDLNTILGHPWAGTLLPDEQRQMKTTVDVIRRGISDVLSQRQRLSSTLNDHIENYDHVKNRELESVLRSINSEMRLWMRSARPRAHVEVELVPPALGIEGLKLKTFDPESERPPEPLEDVTDEAPEALSLDDIRKQGGPSLADLRSEIADRLTTGAVESAAALFNTLPEDLRRPVEILGLHYLLTGMDANVDTSVRELVSAVRPDGTTRQFLMPHVNLSDSVHGDDE
ncbi:DUF3375 family protein [Kribbella sp. NPDC051718]|uniref:DUF3375 family protein n=1 Tax=Kribbella sp. NPDC051718 TaxID=3155168 RepID=UPI0034457F9F